MKRIIQLFLITLFTAGTVTQANLVAATSHVTSSKSTKKTSQGPQGPKGDRGPMGPQGPRGAVGSIATEYMNLSYPLSDDILEYNLEPFSFGFSEHSPDTNSISYIDDAQDPHVILKPGLYQVSYDLECFFGIIHPRDIGPFQNQFSCDQGTGWIVELSTTCQNETAIEMTFKKCTTPVYGGCVSREKNVAPLSKQRNYALSAPFTLALSHSHIVEVPRNKEWLLRLKSVDYPKVTGTSPYLMTNIKLNYKLYFFGNSASSPINMSIVKIGEPS